jgi:hypothetical protein
MFGKRTMGSHPKPEQRAEARRLRRDHGMPVKQIAARLRVSASSVSLWTRDIELTAEQKHRNLVEAPRAPHNPERVARRVDAWRRRSRAKRRSYQVEGRVNARRGDPLHLAGCMLYWAEGGKRRNSITLANSDLHLVRLFCRFLRESLGIDPDAITVSLNVYTNNGLAIEEIEDHWLTALELPRSSLRKHSVNSMPMSSSGGRKTLPYGVCTVSVHSTRLIQHIYGAIQEYGGFDEPRWLDGPPAKPRRRAAP